MSRPNTRSGPARQHVYLSSNFWDGLWIIQQPTCDQIRRTEPVLYVERFVSVFTILRYPRLWTRLFTWLRGAREVAPGLKVLAPLPLFHLGHQVPWLFRLEFWLQQFWIRWWAGRPPASGRVLWLDNPMYASVPGMLGDSVSIYHVADETSAFKESNARIMQALEAETLRRVDLVFAAAEQLREHKARINPRAWTVWNAIDARAFDDEPPAEAFKDIDRIPGPRLVFVGVIDEWCDLALMLESARALPAVQFLFVGPVRIDVAELRALPNSHFLGTRDRMQVPGILRRCSASLVPFRKIALTERILPLKVFEALAAGIMPVCTPFSPDLDTLAADGLVRLGTGAEYVAALEQSIAADTPALRARLSEFGLTQTWAERWSMMSGIIDEALTRRQAVGQLQPALQS